MIYRRLLQFVVPYWHRLFWAFLCMILFSVFNTALVWVMKYVIRVAFVSKVDSLYFIAPMLIMITFLIRGLADFGQAYFMNWVGLKVVSDIREKIYRHLQNLSVDYFSNKKTGQLIARMTNDVTVIQYAISVALTDLIKEPLSLAGLLGTLFYFDPFLALVSLVIFPLAVYPVVKFGKRVREATRRAQNQVGDLTSLLHETITGARVVRAFSMEDYEIQRFNQENRRFFRSMMDSVRASEITRPVIEVVGSLAAAFCFWYGAKHLEFDTFFSFMTALYLIYAPFKKLGKVNSTIQQARAAGERVFEIIDTKPTIVDRPHAKEVKDIHQGIRFNDGWFRYGDGWTLENIQFEMKAGEVTALVGPSGSGKSTLANILARFYEFEKGALEIDGVDIRDITIKSLRAMLGVVTQDVILFNDTVRANIAYGHQEVQMAAVTEAAKAANAHDFITGFPQGYDTVVGEKGVKLSGGERQRIAIARALLKNPKLLILDEATSSLDSESEKLVQEALARLMMGRTVLVIAHRLSTVRNVHQIVVVQEGKIIEIGNHDELLLKGGLYQRLYHVQFSV